MMIHKEVIELILELEKLHVSLRVVDDQLELRAHTGEKIPVEVVNKVKQRKEEIISVLRLGIENVVAFRPIKLVEKKTYYPLSASQKRMFILNQLNPEGIAYNLTMILPLRKGIDLKKIESVFENLINRHESLRTSFLIIDDEPVQRVHDKAAFRVIHFAIKEHALGQLKQQFVQPFDLGQAPLIRVGYAEVEEGSDYLLIDIHHIIADGESQHILEKEFMTLYDEREMPAQPYQYKDYSQWLCGKEQQDLIKQQEGYWINKFSDELPVLELPTDFPRPQVQSFEGANVGVMLSNEETKIIRHIAKELDLTVYMVITAVYNLFLSKISGQQDIIIGTPVAGRQHADLENIVGLFVNTLAIRNEVRANLTVKELLLFVKSSLLQAYANQEYQFEDLVEKIAVARDISRNPVFGVMLTFLNKMNDRVHPEIFDEGRYMHVPGISKFDLSLVVVDYARELELNINYCTKLFRPDTIDRFLTYIRKLIRSLLICLNEKIENIEILTEQEKHQLLFDVNETVVDFSNTKCIHELFEAQAIKTPDKIALVVKDHSITFGELNKKANQWARYLRSKRISRSSVVGLLFDPSVEMIVGLLAVAKSGAVYVPVNTDLPHSQVKYILKDAACSFVLTNNSTVNKKLDFIKVIHVNGDCVDTDASNLKTINEATDPVYIIYTSGSTGNPKGVIICHNNLYNYFSWIKDYIQINNKDKTVLLTSYAFDLGYTALFSSILGGGELHLIDKAINLSANDLVKYIAEKGISYLKLTPSLYNLLLETEGYKAALKNLRIVIMGGEQISKQAVETSFVFNEHVKIVNHYGPTEATIGCITSMISNDNSKTFIENPVIGTSISNTTAYVLNENLKLSPPGISGELCIGGAGLAAGYLNKPELTADKFVMHPFIDGERVYRTGDLAKRLPDGNIAFGGRIDHQVKIRGYRVEPGAIENTLLTHEAVKECIVKVLNNNNEKYLCAYIVSDPVLPGEYFRSFLVTVLPDYMVPAHIVVLDKFPLTTNGKIDHSRLILPKINMEDGYTAPVNEIEEKLVSIWSDILGFPKNEISTNANFFAIGGHSLKAMMLVIKIRKIFSIQFSIKDVFILITIKDIAKYIEQSSKEMDEYLLREMEAMSQEEIDTLLKE